MARRSVGHLLPVLTALLAAAIFVVDTVTGIGVAAAVFYTAVILLSVRFLARRGVILAAAGCVLLTLISSAFTASGMFPLELINTAISIAAIVATTYLALEMESSKAAIDEANAKVSHFATANALGELAASIAHEINQPLAALAMNGNACLRWLTARPPKIGEAKRSAQNIVKDANQAAQIIARVRALTKRAELESTRFNINNVILEALSLAGGDIRKNKIVVQNELSENLPAIRGDRLQLQQVALNLIVNAIDALREVPAKDRLLRISSLSEEMQKILVTICDTGTGFKPGDVNRVFEPFFTTKQEGLGMGLAISRSIVEAHQGQIWATSNDDRGVSFRFTLPVDYSRASK